MTIQYILSENAPSAATPTTLHTNAVGQTSNGTVFCMNRGTMDDRISVALVPSGESLGNSHYICFQTVLNYGHSLYLQQLCLNSEDFIVVESANGTSTFIFSGQATG